MALTRALLKSIGLNEDQINAVIEGHTDTVSALTKERDTYKATADTVSELTKERDSYKKQAEKAGDAAKVQADFDAYKATVEKEKTNARKAQALDAAFKTAGVARDAFRSSMLKAWDMDSVELNDKGEIKDMDGLKAAVQKDFADFVATVEDKPLPPNSPPASGKQSYTREEIQKMKPDEINKNWSVIQKSLADMK